MNINHLTNLFGAIFNCFVIIIFGYVAGRLNIITATQSHGIGNFVGTFSLPALLFKNMVQLNFATVNWALMCSVLFSKTLVFAAVLVVSLILMRKKGLGKAALYAIFSTQSNDFALGYPIVKVLYDKTYPELLQYIYLLAPVSLLILNPIGFALLEIDKHWRNRAEIEESTNTTQRSSNAFPHNNYFYRTLRESERGRTLKNAAKVIRSFLLNPIVLMVFIGLAFHFILNGKLPNLLNQILTTLSNAFSATALFYLGLSMVGKLGNIKGVALIIPATLIAAKILVLPILARESVYLFARFLPVRNPHNATLTSLAAAASNHSNLPDNATYLRALADFGFLYGTFPTAPTVVIYAAKFGLEVDRLASGMVICTTLSAPIMYVSAWTLTITSMKVDYFKEQVMLADQDVSIVGMLCALWCICVFFVTKKVQRMPHTVTTAMTFTMLLASLVTVVSDQLMQLNQGKDYSGSLVVFALLYVGVTATRFYTASLAICVAIVKCYGVQRATRYRPAALGTPLFIAVIVTVIVITCSKETASHTTIVFLHGWVQDVASFSCLLVTLVVTFSFLVLTFRLSGAADKNPASPTLSEMSQSLLSSQNSEDSTPEHAQLLSAEEQPENSHSFPSEDNTSSSDVHSRSPEITRHVVLLLLQTVSLFIGLVLTGWRVMQHKQTGVYFELAFLDSVFNFGQAFFVFVLFGIDAELIIDPFVMTWRKLTEGKSDIALTPLADVDKEVLRKCYVFVKHHLQNCQESVLRDERRGLRFYTSVTTGSNLCSWLCEVGLASDRQEAVLYGQDLMLGRVISHVNNKHYFYDKSYLYRFEDHGNVQESTSPSVSPGPEPSSRVDASVELTHADALPRSGTSRIHPHHRFTFERYLSATDVRTSSVGSPVHRRYDELDCEHFNKREATEETCIDSE